MKIASGVFLLCLGLMFLTSKNNSNGTVIISGIVLLSVGVLLIYTTYNKKHKFSQEQLLSEQKKSEQRKSDQVKTIEAKFIKVDRLALQLSEIQKINIIEISDFKKS
jgi:predicted histidine transporter YuiF (NhaC family)